jgi:hypothetical protein
VGASEKRAFAGFLGSHPVVLLLILTPGIPEYLSGSSAINALVLNPPLFLFQLVANLGLYGAGALLIREAKVRWNKGWASVLLLGAAYGILEEGVALGTLFDPNAGPVGSLGTYGHWLGVNWVWLAGIVPFHAIFSISIPILLLGLALPETSGRRFLAGKRLIATFAILGLDVLFLMVFVSHAAGYWMGPSILAFSLVSIGALILLARRVPAGAFAPGHGAKSVSSRALVSIGISFFPVVLLVEFVPQGAALPAVADFALVVLVQALYPAYLARRKWDDRRRGPIALTMGLLVPIATFGVLSELGFPLILLADVAMVFLFRKIRAMYPPVAGTSQPVS